jgi:hypothetical protein
MLVSALFALALSPAIQVPSSTRSNVTNGAIVAGLLAMAAFDPLNDSEYVLNIIETDDRVTIQLFRTDGRQKINSMLTRHTGDGEYQVGEVRAVPPMRPTESTDANCTQAFALAMLSFGKDASSDGYRRVKLKGKKTDDGNVFVGVISPPYSPSFGSHYILTPKGKVVSSGHGY